NLALAVPHRIQPDEVSKFLWGAYADHYTKNNPSIDDRIKQWLKESNPDNPSRPLPGKLAKEEEAARDVVQKLRDDAKDFLYQAEVNRAQSYLEKGKTSCGECHYFEQSATGSKRVVPPAVKEVWFSRAKFDHVSHRAVDCRACHANAYALNADESENKTASKDAKDVLVPGIANCRQCHATAGHANGQPVGGVRHDCTECHNYHNGDRPVQGLGARSRDPKRLRDVKPFLEGRE